MSEYIEKFGYDTFSCIACGIEKSLKSFARKQRKDGTWRHSKTCASCRNKANAEAQRQWVIDNPDKKAAYRRKRAASGRSAAYQAEWNARNPGKSAGYTRAWQKRNPDAYGIYMRENPWVQRLYNAKRRARNAGVFVGGFTTKELLAAWEGAGIVVDECLYCDAASQGIDHVIPYASGGGHEIANCVPACGSCNSSKHDFTLDDWINRHTRRTLRADLLDRVQSYVGAVE